MERGGSVGGCFEEKSNVIGDLIGVVEVFIVYKVFWVEREEIQLLFVGHFGGFWLGLWFLAGRELKFQRKIFRFPGFRSCFSC